MPLNGFGFGEMLLIAMLVLIVFGPKRLPEVTRTIGKGLREFKKGMNEIQRELEAAGRETAWKEPPSPPNRAAGAASAGAATAGTKATATAGTATAGSTDSAGSGQPASTPDEGEVAVVDDEGASSGGDGDAAEDAGGDAPADSGAPEGESDPPQPSPPVMRDYVDPAEEFIDPWATDSSRPSTSRPTQEPRTVAAEPTEQDADETPEPEPEAVLEPDEVAEEA